MNDCGRLDSNQRLSAYEAELLPLHHSAYIRQHGREHTVVIRNYFRKFLIALITSGYSSTNLFFRLLFFCLLVITNRELPIV